MNSISGLTMLVLCLAVTPSANGAAPQTDDVDNTTLQLPSSERISRTVRETRQLIEDEQYDQAARLIGRLMTVEAGNLAPGRHKHQFLPLHRILVQEVSRLPAALRGSLRATTETVSASDVAAAAAGGRWKDLIAVLQHHPGSSAAGTAELLLAKLHLDKGNRTAARYWLSVASESQLSQAQQKAAQQLIDRISETSADPSASASRPPHADAPEWRIRWHQQEHIGDPRHRAIDRVQTFASGKWATPWNAVVRQEMVIRRTLQGLAAIDLASGQTKWVRRLDSNHLELLRGQPDADTSSASTYSGDRLSRMLMHDGVLSRVCAGDRSVYAIVASSPATQVGVQQARTSTTSEAELVAVSLTDGRRRWTVGGPSLEPQFKSELSDSWFAGPPVTDGRILHLISEHKNEIHLISLNEATGESLDSLLLAFPKFPIHRDPGRRLLAAPPVLHEGILLCSTTTGWLIAVDQLTRTVLWACQTDFPIGPARSVPRFNRGNIVNRAIRNLSPATQVHAFDAQVVVAPWNSRSLLFVDLLTGQLQKRLLPRNRLDVVAKLEDGLIMLTGDGLTLERMDPVTRESLWTTRLGHKVGTPAGPGVVFQQQVTFATTGGSLVTVDTHTGAILSTTVNILPRSNPGTLMPVPGPAGTDATDGDRQMLFVAPDETFCLTTGSEPPSPSGIVEQVTQLKAAGNLKDAWSLLVQTPPEEFQRNEQLRDLRFEVALLLDIRIRLQGTETSDNAIPDRIAPQDLAVKPRHRQLLRIVQVGKTIHSHPDQAALEAIKLAEHPQAGRITLPAEWLTAASDSVAQQASAARVSLTTWAAHVVETAIDSVSPEQLSELLKQLNDASIELLVQIRRPQLSGIIRERLWQTTEAEQTLRLAIVLSRLQAGSGVADRDDVPVLTETAAWSRLLEDTQDAGRPLARQQALHQLLATIEAETTDESGRPAFRIDGLPSWAERDDNRRQWQDSWNQSGFNVVPFARSGPSRQRAIRLQCRDPLDAICRAFDFVQQRNPNRMSIHYRSPNPARLWSISRQPPAATHAPGSARIQRLGSLLLYTAGSHIAVLSMIDQRLMWEHSDPFLSTLDGTTDTRTIPELREERDRRSFQSIDGKPFDWLCLVKNSGLSVVDAYSGFPRWSIPIGAEQRVAVTESAILITDGESLTALDPEFGTGRSSRLQPQDVWNAVDQYGPEIFIAASDESSSTLNCSWKNPLTGEISLQEELSDVALVQHPPGGLLAVVHKNRDVSVVDIAHRQLQQYPWQQSPHDDAASESQANDWNPNQIQYYQDEDFIYLLRKPDHRITRGRIPNRTLAAFDRIRVLDRQSGTQLWELELPENESARAVTDQLSLPFLAVIQEAVDPVSGKRLGYVQFRCYHKRTGQLLVDSRLPSRFSYDQLRIEAEDDHSIMLQLHGTQVRFEHPDSPSIIRPVSSPPTADESD